MQKHKPVIVIGAGAAGLMCAAKAGARGREVLVLDHANKPGKKILMSGGGRCNFTNLDVRAEHYICQNSHFCKSALSRYTQWHFLELVNQYHIPYHEKSDGQLFCDNKSSDILDMLLRECESAKVNIKTGCTINRVEKRESRFFLNTTLGDFSCDSLVVATGGLSIPTMGATGFGYQVAEQFGIPTHPRRASLVPFTLTDRLKETAAGLSGVSMKVTVANTRKSFTGDLLFTHRGVSGPAILQMSNYWELGEALTLNFLPDYDLNQQYDVWRHTHGKQTLKNALHSLLSKRFVNTWLESIDTDKPLAETSRATLNACSQALQAYTFVPAGTEGYRTAEVTMGGVDTNAVSSKTFEVKHIPGLYFIGEVLDVTGWLGGYNFQWAWASGACAAEFV